MNEIFIQNLKKQLELPLPGRAAQLSMAHGTRRLYKSPQPDSKIACVLVLFYPKNGEWFMVLIHRTSSNPNDRHGGQIGFPGGRYETTDGSLLNAALREANEEIGIVHQDVKIIGRLSELYIPVSDFLVHPFVGHLDYMPVFIPQESEVRGILEVPFEVFFHKDTLKKMDLPISNKMILKEVPYFDIDGQVVWGATAMMLGELLAVANQAK